MSDYDSLPGIRRSDLWYMNRSPLHFRNRMDGERERTDALRFGSATHKYILEPETFWDEYAVAPAASKRTKAGKEEWDAFSAMLAETGKDFVTDAELDIISEMAAEIGNNDLAAELLTGKHEVVYSWYDPDTDERCKVKADVVTEYEGRPFLVDYKTTVSCEDGHFERDAKKYGYQFQAGMYCEGYFQTHLEECGFAFVAQEKTAPYAVRVYICSPGWIARGYDKFRELIGTYHKCRLADDWPGYDRSGIPVELLED